MRRFLVSACLLLLLGSCRTDAEHGDGSPAASVSLPASALLGAVRALETLGAVRPAGTLVRLRALESDSMVEPGSGRETVRVFLHLTVYSDSAQRSFDAFEELRFALQDEAGAARRAGVSSERVVSVFGALDWEAIGREDLVSYSDVVRLEVSPGSPAPRELAGVRAATPKMPVEAYVRQHAATEGLGALDLWIRAKGNVGKQADLRCRIEGAGRDLYTRAQIGAFLGALEAGSPAARLTHLEVERSWEATDLQAARVWTFAAELAVRAQ